MTKNHNAEKTGRQELLDRDEAAARLRVHKRTIDRAVKRGELRSVYVGRRHLIAADSVDALIAGE
jgi:excisionase family DNA binding protein